MKKKFKIVYRNPADLKDYPDNAKIHTDDEVEKLVKIIDNVGFDVPIVYDENDVIIKGHKRKRAAISLGLNTVPAILRDDMTEEEKRAARLADNKVSEGEYDYDILRKELEGLQELGIDMSLTGYDQYEIDDIMNNLFETSSEIMDNLEDGAFLKHLNKETEQFQVTFVFEKEDEDVVKGMMKEKGKDYFRDMIVDHCKELKDA